MIKHMIDKYRFLKDPVQYSRKLGVQIGMDCSIMGTRFPFGTEPYLVKLGNHVRINDGVQFITHDGSVWVLRESQNYGINVSDLTNIDSLRDIDLFGQIEVGDNVQIGERAIILPNVRIGSNVIIGACALVTKDIPNNSVAAGIPAKVIESIEEYYIKNKERFVPTKPFSATKKKEFLMNYYGLHNNDSR